VTMHLSSTVMEIWPFEVFPGRLFQEQRSVGRSVLNITLISYTGYSFSLRSKRSVRRVKNSSLGASLFDLCKIRAADLGMCVNVMYRYASLLMKLNISCVTTVKSHFRK